LKSSAKHEGWGGNAGIWRDRKNMKKSSFGEKERESNGET
jgi:hypothetical protein